MRFGPRAITIVNAVLLVAASSTSLLAQARMPTAAGLWEKLDSSGRPEAEFQIMDCNGLYQGKIVKIFPRPGENPSTFRMHRMQRTKTPLAVSPNKGIRKRPRVWDGSILDPLAALPTVPLWSLAPMDRRLPFGAILAFRSSGRAKSCVALLIIRPNLAAIGLARPNSRGVALAQSKCSFPIRGDFPPSGLRPPCSCWHPN